jgi:hypothetical protein
MRKILPLIATIGMFALGSVTALAQFTITIPNIPKVKKSKPQQPAQPTDSSDRPTTSTNQTESEPTSTSAKNNCSDGFTQVHTENMEKTRKEAENYSPGSRDYYVEDFNDNRNEYLRAALSPTQRQEWLTSHNIEKENYPCFVPLFDAIATAAKKTLPLYQPAGYNIHNPAEEKLMLGQVNDIAQAKVLKIGLKSTDWRIAKDDYNFPTSRYKWGMIWARYPNLDDGFCRIIYVNIVQDYAGGGTYGASYGNFIKSEYAGCPAGK